MNVIQEITKPYLRTDLLLIKVGDKVEVTTKIFDKKDQEKYKLSSFKGIVISLRREKQISANFTVIKESGKLMVKKIFFLHSALLNDIKKLGRIEKKVRRAKLYFLERELAKKKDRE